MIETVLIISSVVLISELNNLLTIYLKNKTHD